MTVVLGVAIGLQIVALIMAIRLVGLARARLGWVLMAIALALMIARRSFTLTHVLADGSYQLDPVAEWAGLGVSAILAAALTYLAPTLQNLRRARDLLAE